MHRRHLLQASLILPAAIATERAFAQPASPVASPSPDIAPFETTEVNGVDLAYRIAGSGDPLIMLMGYGGTMDAWNPAMQAALESQYQVVTFDHRGAGSSSPTPDYPFAQLADDVIGLMDALGIETGNVFGWSMGSMIGNDLAARHGDRVRRIVLHAGDSGGTSAVPPNAGSIDDTMSQEEAVQASIDRMIPAPYAAAHRDELVALFTRPAAPITDECVRQQTSALISRYMQEQSLEDIAVPAMVLHGNEDMVVPTANAVLVADRIANSWLVRLPGGHGVIYQYPETIATLVSTFLSSDAIVSA